MGPDRKETSPTESVERWNEVMGTLWSRQIEILVGLYVVRVKYFERKTMVSSMRVVPREI